MLVARGAGGLQSPVNDEAPVSLRAIAPRTLGAVYSSASFLRPRPWGPRIGLPPALLFGRRRHAFLIVLDLRCVWLSAFSTAVVRQVRLRAGTWWGGRL